MCKIVLISFYLEVLKSENLLLYPTDTIWGIGCDATSAIAIQKILILKNRPSLKSMIILVNNIDMIQHYTDFDLSPLKMRLLSENRPTTFIIPFAKNLPENLIANDRTIAFRIPKHYLCLELINGLKKPIISLPWSILDKASKKSIKSFFSSTFFSKKSSKNILPI